VAIARDLILRAHRGEMPGIPTANVIRFASDGTIDIEGPVAAGGSVERAARLLDAMLSGHDAPAEMRVPGALRLVLSRAFGALDVPAFRSLKEFADALSRFAELDTATAVSALYERWTSAAGAPGAGAASGLPGGSGPSISDVRRARRSTGLTLSEISERTRIPVSLLRELEWGYFVNWPGGHYGRSQLARYAHAVGLDDGTVINAVWPLLEEAVRDRMVAVPSRVVDGAIIDDDQVEGLVWIEPALPAVPLASRSPRRRGLLAAASIAALLTVALIPALWNADRGTEQPAQLSAAATVSADIARPATSEPAARDHASSGSGPIAGSRAAERSRVPDTSVPPLPQHAVVRPAALRSDAAFSPAFASTGSAMFYHSGAGDGSAIMQAETDARGEVLRVTSIIDDSSSNFHARPSPDGRTIAFDSDRDGERAVYIADGDGRNVRRVSEAGFAAVPSWSPDGGRLAYVRAEPGRPRVWNLWVAELDGGESTRLTAHPYGQPWGAAWFPDGERIAYSHEDRLIVRTIDGRQQQTFPSPRKGQLLRTPAVSPDGRWVVFQVYRDGAWILNLDDSSMRRILADPTAEEFTWSSDGRRVAYHSRQTGDWSIWQMAAR
jgi:Tol biopolymer transport system component